ncbi:MAG: lysylphosphatidylglycerol synthase transmembrane domain-containing protein, partial [Eubacteriales bacterium]
STRLVSRLPDKARGMYERFLSGTMSSFQHNGQIAALTAVIWFLEGVSFYLVTRAIGMKLSFVAVIFIGLVSALLTALPITPAGLGIVETAKVGVLVFFNVDGYVAVSAALLDRIINYWSLLLFGIIVYLASEHTMSKEAKSDESDDSHSYVQ